MPIVLFENNTVKSIILVQKISAEKIKFSYKGMSDTNMVVEYKDKFIKKNNRIGVINRDNSLHILN